MRRSPPDQRPGPRPAIEARGRPGVPRRQLGVARAYRGRRAPLPPEAPGERVDALRTHTHGGGRPPTGGRGFGADPRATPGPKIVTLQPRAPKMDGLLCERDVALGSTRTGRRIGTTAAEARYVCASDSARNFKWSSRRRQRGRSPRRRASVAPCSPNAKFALCAALRQRARPSHALECTRTGCRAAQTNREKQTAS